MPDTLWIILMAIAVLAVALLIYASRGVQRAYRQAVQSALDSLPRQSAPMLTQDHIAHLPAPVQRYLHFAGAVGKDQVRYVKVVANGAMKLRSNTKWARVPAWSSMTSAGTSSCAFFSWMYGFWVCTCTGCTSIIELKPA